MPQISLYVDEETMAGLRKDAKRGGQSISKYVGGLIRNESSRGGYPEGFFALYGCLSDDTFKRPDDELAEPVKPLFA